VLKFLVSLKTGVLDPQGKAIERSLHTLGYGEVRDARWQVSRARIERIARAAELRIREMCDNC
jgi:phosphoribosylformylglycinamidine synthase